MHRLIRLGALTFVVAGLLWGVFAEAPGGPTPATADPGVPARSMSALDLGYFPGQVLVCYRDPDAIPTLRSAQAFSKAAPVDLGVHSMEIHRTVPGLVTVKISGDVQAAVAHFQQDPAVLYAEPSYVRYLQRVPNDPLFPQQRNMEMSRGPLGWDLRTAALGAKIAVIDTGVDFNHPDLQGVTVGGTTFNTRGDQGGSAQDDSGHGTAVAGVIGALGNNGQFVAGSMWQSEIIGIRSCGTQSLICTIPDEVEAIDIAIAQQAKVINLSLGGFSSSITEENGIKRAQAAGLLVVAATGNGVGGEGQLGKFDDPTLSSNIFYPAGYAGVIGVGSVDPLPNPENLNGIKKSKFSNYGDMVDVVAVGSSVVTLAPSAPVSAPIFRCDPGACYHEQKVGQISGTSFATPLVSGLAAAIFAQFPDLTASEVSDIITSTARDIGTQNADGRNDEFGFGLVDFFTALSGRGGAVNDAFVVGVAANPIYTNQVYITIKKRKPLVGTSQPRVVVEITQQDGVRSLEPAAQTLASDPNILFYRFLVNGNADIKVTVDGTLAEGGTRSLAINYKKDA